MAAVRIMVGRAVRRSERTSGDEGRRMLVLVRNMTLLIGVASIALVWADELRVVGLSLVAVAVAVAISTQDLIRSVVASFVRAASGSYTIGDRIVVGDVRGYVIDHSLLQTTLLEIGPGNMRTGRTITMPNSHLLGTPVINETAGNDFVLHSFEVPVPESRWREAMDFFREAAVEASAPFVDAAREAMEERAQRHSIHLPIVEPLVFTQITGEEKVSLTVRVPVEASEAGRVEREIVHRWLEHLQPGVG